MNTFYIWLAIICAAVIGVIIGLTQLAERVGRKYREKRKKERAFYMDRTLPCPKCFGRGRIPRPGWHFTEDSYKEEFEEEMKVIDIPYLVREAMEKDDKGRT